ncbi:MAG: hypothetical protein ACREN7_06275 [Candidatus Dormibacteria bacterium]
MPQHRFSIPRLTPAQWLIGAVVLFIIVATFFEVISSLGKVSPQGAPQAELNGRLPTAPLQMNRLARFTLALDASSGSALDPACVGGNLRPEFEVVSVTFLGTPGSRWKAGRSCGEILETGSTVPIVVTVIPLHPGDYTVKLWPQSGSRRAGSGTEGEISVRG